MRAKFVNEGIKHLSGRDDAEWKQYIESELARNEKRISPAEKKAIDAGNENLIYHVFSGVDAFVFERNREEVFPPYIAVIAKNQRDAREKAAKILGQKLTDQVTTQDYGENYIYTAEFVPKNKRYYGAPPEYAADYASVGEKPRTVVYHVHVKNEDIIFTTNQNEKIAIPYISIIGFSNNDVLKNASIFIGRELKPEEVRIKFIRYF